MIVAREFTSAAEMRYAAAAVHRRCFNTRPKPRLELIEDNPEMVSVIVVSIRDNRPAWIITDTHFDAHVAQHQSRQVEIAMNPARVHIKDRCREIGVRYEVIVGSDRRQKIADIRHLLMWEVHQEFGLSFPALGRLFGGRDHTTCLYAIRKVEAMRGIA